MAPADINEIDRTIQPVAGAADTLPNTAGREPFAASVHHTANETAHCDRLVSADPFASFHNEGDRA